MNTPTTLAAAPAISGMQIFGAITLSGLALASAICLLAGLRGSKKIKIDNRDKAAWWGILTGTLWEAAGGTWSDIAEGISSVPQGVFGGSSTFGNPGLGGMALALTLITFVFEWKRLVIPALFGIAASVVYGEAGGIWGIFVNIVRMIETRLTGGA
ncbi:hypothetical protein ACFV1C_00200 [Streptomyces sp. NPDC059605]|uniref:hypothetical protein n=1 Tax=Streptomyces sp. NPDC059605 TaxID=3346882 RepID=UPI00367BA4F1